MRLLSKILSQVINPLFIPLVGTVLYFLITPKYNTYETKRLVVLAVLILTVIIPLILFLLLKNLGWITGNEIETAKEKKIPLYIAIILIYITFQKITTIDFSEELYFFFVGILGALLSCLIMVYLNFKASIHAMAISALLVFILGLSFHYETNITLGISAIIFVLGLVATIRLYLQKNDLSEIAVGVFLGGITQFITFGYWL
ncbi:hypothetical protein [Joostella sp. CR20]|uniref:hypothetical protein n=1 Tax=Joostella sp. CR20 TaxID=2804312 RepID=UPI00313E544F